MEQSQTVKIEFTEVITQRLVPYLVAIYLVQAALSIRIEPGTGAGHGHKQERAGADWLPLPVNGSNLPAAGSASTLS